VRITADLFWGLPTNWLEKKLGGQPQWVNESQKAHQTFTLSTKLFNISLLEFILKAQQRM
jgi:hypothetical protein